MIITQYQKRDVVNGIYENRWKAIQGTMVETAESREKAIVKMLCNLDETYFKAWIDENVAR
jgi:hypothetical protein